MSRIDLNVVATGNFGQLEGQLARLKAQVAGLNASMSSGMMINPAAIAGMQNYSNLMADNLRSTGMFQTKMVSLTSETERFGQSLQRGNIRLGDYFRTATGHIRNQQTEIQRLAREQVRLMNSTSLAMGDGRAMVITPTGIDEAIHKQQILNQEYRIFRQVVQGGSTQLINWGKNTQWAGRQLTVGLTVPLTIFGAAAAKTFMEADKQLTRLTKVYGDAARGVVSPGELQSIRQQTLGLAKDIASSMGVAAEETLAIAADIAATGKEGNELLASTSEAMRLSVLGEVDRQEAMRATLSIQSVFKKDTEGLAESINFLNAVENETSASINDLVTGIVKAGPVVQGLGGDIEDLALMMVAMREGGIPASEAANAIKSSLASLINPTKQTTQTLNAFGIDLISIVDKNAGDVIGTLIDLQGALAGLDELSRQRAIEQIFGKFQFSRINALLNNLGKAGSQTQEVLKLAGLSVEDLAANADQELKAVTDSVSGRFQRALESLKANLIPIGEIFTQVGTMLLEVGSKILEIFNSLPTPVKNFVQGLMFLTGLAGPIIMITGVFGNFLGYLLKGVSSLMAIKQAGRGVFEYFTPESIAAKNASELITKAFYDEEQAIHTLNNALEQLNKTLVEMQANSSAAVGSMQGLAAGTMAAAESAAASGGVNPISIYKGKGSLTYTGGEFSHITPESTLKTIFDSKELKYLMTPGTLLGSGDLAEKEFQSKMVQNFAAGGYYNPSTMGSRSEALLSMASPENQGLAQDLIRKMTEGGMARLYPTMEEHTAEVAKYQIAIERLFEKNNAEIKEIVKEIEAKIASGDLDGAAEVLKRSIDNGDGMLEKLITQRAQEYRDEFNRIYQQAIDEGFDASEANIMATQEMQIAATERERLAYESARAEGRLTDTGFGNLGARMSRQQSGMAVAALSGTLPIAQELENATRSRIDAMNLVADADAKLATTDQRLSQMSTEELAAINKDINSREVQYGLRQKTNAGEQRFARIQGQWAQVTANGIRDLNLKNTKEKNLAAALEQRMIAERRLAVANARLERLKTEEARASYLAAQANLKEADASLKAAQADIAEAATGGGVPGVSGAAGGRGLKGKLAGGAGLGALSALSMATMMVPAEEGSGMAQGMDVVGGIGMGASMGAMIGSIFPGAGTAIGAAVGGVIGGVGPVLSIFSDNAAKAAAEVENLRLSAEIAAGAVGDLEKDFLGMDIKELEDLPFQVFGDRTEEASSQLDQFTQALIAATAAEEGSLEKQRVEEIKKFASGAELVNSSMFMEMIGKAIISGTDPDQLKMMFQAYLDVADKEVFATAVNNAIDSFMPDGASIQSMRKNFIKKTSETLSAITADIRGEGSVKNPAAAARLMAEENALDALRGGKAAMIGDKNVDVMDILKTVLEQNPIVREEIMRGGRSFREGGDAGVTGSDASYYQMQALQKTGLAELKIDGQVIDRNTALSMLSSITSILETSPDINELTSDVIKLSDASKMMAGNIADSMATLSGKEFAEVVKSIDPSTFQRNSAELSEFVSQLTAIPEIGPEIANAFQTMINNGTSATTAFKALKLMTAGTNMTIQELIDLASGPEPEFNYVYKQTFVQEGSPVGFLPQPTQGASMPTDAVTSAISAMGGVETGGGGGGGGSDTSAIEGIFDKRIKAQDKIIEGIKKEREERQKLLNLEKQAFDFAMQEQDLKNQIARARAEGRTAEAAMLQSQLDNARATEKQDEQERIRQENEDRRIRKAERTKQQLERAKSRATESAGGGGGGAADGISQAVADAIKVASMELTAWTKSDSFLKIAGKQGPFSAFFDSKRIKEFRAELESLGVPVELIESILDSAFDSFIMNNEEYKTSAESLRGDLEKVGLVGEDLEKSLPNIYAAMIDKSLNAEERIAAVTKEFENAGYGADEARKKALEFFDTSNKAANFEKIRAIADAYRKVAGEARAASLEAALVNYAVNNPDVTPAKLAAYTAAVQADFATLGGSATGGYITGPGTSMSDSIVTRLSNGEYVIRASAVDKFGVPFFDALNKGMIPMMAGGGMVSRYPSIAAGMARGGYVRTGYNTGGLVSGNESEYNINVYVTESNASADDIASRVMQSLQRRDKMNRAGIRI